MPRQSGRADGHGIVRENQLARHPWGLFMIFIIIDHENYDTLITRFNHYHQNNDIIDHENYILMTIRKNDYVYI